MELRACRGVGAWLRLLVVALSGETESWWSLCGWTVQVGEGDDGDGGMVLGCLCVMVISGTNVGAGGCDMELDGSFGCVRKKMDRNLGAPPSPRRGDEIF
ncbi:flavoprotein [Sesbania bispinosa]|nr:flavoprotein [Sesbania bispinosa]